MRKTIGNITIYPDQQKSRDTGNESLRETLRRQWRQEKSARDARGHVQRITGRQDIEEAITYFFDKEGRPPANMGLDDLVKQYNILRGKAKWLNAITAELRRKLEQLDSERYLREEATTSERERIFLEEREQAYQEYIATATDSVLKNPVVRDTIRKMLQKEYRLKQRRLAMRQEFLTPHLLGLKHVETMLSLLFSRPVPGEAKYSETHYLAMREGLMDMELTAAEIDLKLYNINDLIDSAYAYINKN